MFEIQMIETYLQILEVLITQILSVDEHKLRRERTYEGNAGPAPRAEEEMIA
jgi:hypothetical protein